MLLLAIRVQWRDAIQFIHQQLNPEAIYREGEEGELSTDRHSKSTKPWNFHGYSLVLSHLIKMSDLAGVLQWSACIPYYWGHISTCLET